MNLISCNNCGVVLDKDKLLFPDIHNPITGVVDTTLAVWDGDTYIPKVQCPVCGADILKD